MNETIINNWNKVVGNNDIIYHLGDFALASNNIVEKLVSQLNGRINMILGSHDGRLNKRLFNNASDNELIDYYGIKLFASHYLHKVWPLSHYGIFHIFGHSHSTMNDYAAKEGKLLDVGVDSHNFTPWSIDEIIEVMKTRPDNFNLVKKSMQI